MFYERQTMKGDEDGEFELEEEEVQAEISENVAVHLSSVQSTSVVEVNNQNLPSPQNSNPKTTAYVSSTQIMNLQLPSLSGYLSCGLFS